MKTGIRTNEFHSVFNRTTTPSPVLYFYATLKHTEVHVKFYW